MAKMSQKELLEEGFSDKIRGIAKAAGAGLKQAAAQGTRLDTGQLAKGMTKAYKGQQPIAVLKEFIAQNKKMDIVKIDKSGIKKQQASAKKGYIGRIVGPKSITLIPFEGVLLGEAKKEDPRKYEGSGAGVMEAFAPEDAEVAGAPRDEKGQIKAVHKKGAVVKQINKLLIKHGVEESAAAKLSPYAAHIRMPILKIIQKTHPNIKFTFNPKPEMGGFDVEKAEPDIAEVKPDDFRAKTESVSLRDIIRLSGEVLIVEATSKRQAELRERARKVKVPYSRYEKMGRGGLDELQKAVEAAEAAAAEGAGADPVAEPGRSAKEAIERGKESPDTVINKAKKKKKEAAAERSAAAEPEKEEPVYPGHEKFVATLDDNVIIDLLKLKQKIQPGLQIEFDSKKSGYQGGKPEMFVAEIFRTEKGLAVGDIYRQGNPAEVVLSGDSGTGAGKAKADASPFDEVVAKLTAENQLNVQMLVPRLQQHRLLKSNKKILSLTADIIKKYTGRSDDKLQEVDIKKIKAGLIKDRIIAEGTSQKNLLRQLTLLSR